MTQSSNDYVTPDCKVENCPKEANGSKGYCSTHYWRLWKYGDPGPAERAAGAKGLKRLPTICYRDDCDRPRKIGVRCLLHGRRFEKHGDEDYVGRRPPNHSSSSEGAWKGKPPSKVTVMDYVYTHKGQARSKECTQCFGRADRWAYNHRDPNELTTPKGEIYSRWPEYYEPMCYLCEEQMELHRPRLRRKVASNG